MLLVNNSYPGPVLEATEGELVCVTVLNNLLIEPVAIHWHGLHMRGSPSMDGVYGVTQVGKFYLSCDVTVVNHFSHRVIVSKNERV